MEKRVIRIFTIHSDQAEKIREELVTGFPSFLADLMSNKETFQIKYSELGNARFEKNYGYSIKDWVSMAFFKNKDKTKHSRRKLNASINDDM
mgnify:CR=1 FL=1